MSAQAMEVVDEFAPASAGVEEGRYLFRYVKAFETSGQYGTQNVHILDFVEVEGESMRAYTDQKMSKGSQQRQLIEAFLGRELQDGEQATPRMLKGKDAYGDVEFNKNGRPKIVKFFKVRQPAATTRAVDDDGVVTTPAPVRPAPPPRPAAAAAIRSDGQRDRLLEAATENEYDLATLTNWIAQTYAGKTIDTISPEEAEALIEGLRLPF